MFSRYIYIICFVSILFSQTIDQQIKIPIYKIDNNHYISAYEYAQAHGAITYLYENKKKLEIKSDQTKNITISHNSSFIIVNQNIYHLFSPVIYKNNDFIDWKNEWKKRSELNNSTKEKQSKLMKSNNPIVIPRNHKVEEALAEADKGNLGKMKKLLNILKNPYDNQNSIDEYQLPAPSSNEKYQTFCGT